MNAAGPKHRGLSRLLSALEAPLFDGRLAVDTRWRDNEEALGLYAPDAPGVSAFVFTYGQPEGCYGVELGYPDRVSVEAARVETAQEVLEFHQAVALLCMHFDLPERV